MSKGVLYIDLRKRAIPAARPGGAPPPPRPGQPQLAIPSMARRVDFQPSLFRILFRLVLWAFGLLQLVLGTALATLLWRNTVESRAVRLRRIFERMGPTFIKVGQQLALRADILDFAYCQELAKMQDSVRPIPIKVTRRIVRKALGCELEAVFSELDPNPVGSGSLATVYRATRKDGSRVAVKVRRPGIGMQLAADLRAFFWILNVAKVLTLLRPDMVQNLKMDLYAMLMEEVDFKQEARFLEIYRKRAKKTREQYVTVPRVHFDLSGDDVLVMDLVSATPMTEILRAVDRGDAEKLSRMAALGIDPVELAKRLMHVYNWETLENLIFHADPHPANIFVLPGNKLIFIDFGSCGHLPAKNRRIWSQIQSYIQDEDVSGITTAVLSLMEPLPPIDVDRYRVELENHFRSWLYALKSKHSEWWERSSGVLWMRLVGVARRYDVPFQIDTLRLVRTLFAIDTIIYRLDPHHDRDRTFQAYRKAVSRRIDRRFRKGLRKRLWKGPTPDDIIQVQTVLQTAQSAVRTAQRLLDLPRPRFVAVIEKMSYVAHRALRFGTVLVALLAGYRLAESVYRLLTGRELPGVLSLESVLELPIVQAGMGVMVILFLRRILSRLREPDVD